MDTASEDTDRFGRLSKRFTGSGRIRRLVPALIAARDADTQVAVLVELKARFDEANNIGWARQLEETGIHVVYGLIGLKTHCKALLVVRQEGDKVIRYMHLGTGNYNAENRPPVYRLSACLTSDPYMGADLSDLFNYLTGFLTSEDIP